MSHQFSGTCSSGRLCTSFFFQDQTSHIYFKDTHIYQRKQAGICYKIQNTCWMGKGVTNFKYHASRIGSTNLEWWHGPFYNWNKGHSHCQCQRTTKHFTNFPCLKEGPWFFPLFERAPRGWKQAMPDHDAKGLEHPTQWPRRFDSETLPIENFTQITQLEYPIASSSRIQLPFLLATSILFR